MSNLMLTKEEYLEALQKIEEGFGCDMAYYNLHEERDCLKMLINEHFELLKCVKEMYDQNDIDAMQFEINLLQIKNTRLEKELERYKTMLKTFK